MATTSYSYKNVVATFNNQPIQGLFEGDDAIVVTENADIGSMTIGADGSSIFSQAVNDAATISIKLQHTSATHKRLSQLLKRQKARGALGTGAGFAVKDRASGEGGATDQAFIMTAPDQSFGTNATVREWVLVTGSYKRSE